MPFIMNIWLAGAFALLFGLASCLVIILRAGLMEALVGVQMGSTIAILILLLLAQGYGRPSFADLALALAFLSFPGSLLFAHFFERWL